MEEAFDPLVSVILPTFRRDYFLPCVLKALASQSYKNFEVLVVLKPSGDNSEKVIQSQKKNLELRLFLQKQGYISRGFNIGLRNAKGSIIVFTEDDTIPPRDFIEKHVKEYTQNHNLGGLTGECVYFVNENLAARKTDCSVSRVFRQDKYRDIISNTFRSLGRPINWVLDRSTKGFENYDVGLSISGKIFGRPQTNKSKSINFWAGNMSFRREAIRELYVYEDSLNPYRFEAFLATVAVLRGFEVCEYNGCGPFNYHIFGDYASQVPRRGGDWFKVFQIKFEEYLLFYRIKRLGLKLSWFAFISRCMSNFIYFAIKLRDSKSYVGALLALILVHFYGIFVLMRRGFMYSSVFSDNFLRLLKPLRLSFKKS
ncbi:MAG TPA: glycosyltransferase family 2 protein [Candidatus Bathyarchaeia archaeon]|nr:glycosyltransferase family 2 protein [Candidatus Bathyarchaeia archaeon]